MAKWESNAGRPLTPAEAERLKALVMAALEPVEGVVEHSTILSLMADERLRMMRRQGVPLDQILASDAPDTIAEAVERWGLTPQKARALRYAAQNTGVYLSGFADQAKSRIVKTVNALQTAGVSPEDASRKLFQEFAGLNRDWRMIAVTEAAQNANNGYLMGRPSGSYVVGQSHPDACSWCLTHFHGKVLRVVEPPGAEDRERDWENEIWVGKSNYGRYQSATERGTGRERSPGETWKPAVLQHPGCRCWLAALDPRFQRVTPEGDIVVREDI